MARPSKREQIVEEGLRVVRERGFATSGVRDIVRAAGVPQGSFTNHFASKEAFGLTILDRYFDDVRRLMDATLGDSSRPPIERLEAYIDAVIDRFSSREWRHGCLVGNMSLEATEHSEPIRARLVELFAEWRERFAACIEEAAAAGDITVAIPAGELADFFITSWHGAMLRMKVERSPEPLLCFKDVVFTTVLNPRRSPA